MKTPYTVEKLENANYPSNPDGIIRGPNMFVKCDNIEVAKRWADRLNAAYALGMEDRKTELEKRLETATHAEDNRALSRLEADMAALPDNVEEPRRTVTLIGNEMETREVQP